MAWSVSMTSRLSMLLLCAALLAAGACGVVAQSRGMSRAEVYAQVDLLAELGRRLFFDPSLSASGRLSCASCHDPAHAYGPADERAVMPGGKDMRQSGLRAVPSLRYLQAAPAFIEHFRDSDDEGDASVDNGPTGGLTWDGRVDRGRDQARLPLLSSLEMANDSPAEVVAAVRRSPHADLLRRAFGKRIFADPERAFDGILQALEAYEQRYTEFYPYGSNVAARVLSQWRLPHPAPSARILRRARYPSREMVSARGRWHGAQVRRPAAAVSCQRQYRAAVRPARRRRAASVRRRDRRHHRLPADADRRLSEWKRRRTGVAGRCARCQIGRTMCPSAPWYSIARS